jgi:hypothetical protein
LNSLPNVQYSSLLNIRVKLGGKYSYNSLENIKTHATFDIGSDTKEDSLYSFKTTIRLEAKNYRQLGWDKSWKIINTNHVTLRDSEITKLRRSGELLTFKVTPDWDIK